MKSEDRAHLDLEGEFQKIAADPGLAQSCRRDLAQRLDRAGQLTPFVLPPLDTNSQTMFLCSSSRIKNVGENPIYFGDYSLFKARYKQEAGGFLFFQLPDCPEVILCGTSQSTSRTAYYKNYVSEMPKEIQQVFDVDGVNEQISISRFKNISNIPVIHRLQKRLFKQGTTGCL